MMHNLVKAWRERSRGPGMVSWMVLEDLLLSLEGVPYHVEQGEIYQSPWKTLEEGGDCDCLVLAAAVVLWDRPVAPIHLTRWKHGQDWPMHAVLWTWDGPSCVHLDLVAKSSGDPRWSQHRKIVDRTPRGLALRVEGEYGMKVRTQQPGEVKWIPPVSY